MLMGFSAGAVPETNWYIELNLFSNFGVGWDFPIGFVEKLYITL